MAELNCIICGIIFNADVNASANIQSDKLNLTSVAQAFGITASGSFVNSGNTTLNGTTNAIGNGGSDTLALNLGGGLSSSAMTWTLSGSLTFSGTIADLGTVTTANIDGGTIDGTAIGSSSPGAGSFSTLKVGTTNQGDILYDNGTSLVRLTPGTSGQFLKTQGSSANPIWDSLDFGSWGSGTFNSATQASTDGFIVLFGTSDGGESGDSKLTIKTDASNPPTTIRGVAHYDNPNSLTTVMCPVKSGEYYLAEDATGDFGSEAVYFIADNQ